MTQQLSWISVYNKCNIFRDHTFLHSIETKRQNLSNLVDRNSNAQNRLEAKKCIVVRDLKLGLVKIPSRRLKNF